MSDCLTHSWSDDVVECLYCKIELLEKTIEEQAEVIENMTWLLKRIE